MGLIWGLINFTRGVDASRPGEADGVVSVLQVCGSNIGFVFLWHPQATIFPVIVHFNVSLFLYFGLQLSRECSISAGWPICVVYFLYIWS